MTGWQTSEFGYLVRDGFHWLWIITSMNTVDNSVNWGDNCNTVYMHYIVVIKLKLNVRSMRTLDVSGHRRFYWEENPTNDKWATTVHCGPRGCNRHSQLYEHLSCMFWASNYRPTTGHKMVSSDLDSLLNSTPFWCKNHFCSLKTKEVIKYFLTKNIFPTAPS